MTTERLKEIKLIIAKEWKNDFEMQKLTLDSQIESYDKIEKLKAKNINDTFLIKLLLTVSKEWKDDYEMQLHTIKEQLKSAKKLTEYTNDKIPNNIL